MKKITFAFVWLISFIVLLAVCDQFLIRYPGADTPMLGEFQSFYRDLRQRVLDLEYRAQPQSVQQVISARGTKEGKSGVMADETASSATENLGRYIYVDEHNTLNFADSLDQIPEHLRTTAKNLDQ